MSQPPLSLCALRVETHGRVAYAPMLAHQEATHARVVAGQQDDTLLLLEHPPVVTAGRGADDAHLRLDPRALAARGVEFHRSGRGGDVTYHGPGQLVGYAIVRLRPHEQDVRAYVGRLEAALIRTAADFGVAATRVPGLRGIWVGNDKLAAIGVRLARWTTLHGFALNVDVAPEDFFACIVPCGLHGRGVTSLARASSRPAPAAAAVRAAVAHHVAASLGRGAPVFVAARLTAAAPAAAALPPSSAPSAAAALPPLLAPGVARSPSMEAASHAP